MTRDELLRHVDRLLEKYRAMQVRGSRDGWGSHAGAGERAEVEEFLRKFAGQDSAFFQRLHEIHPAWCYHANLVSALEGYRSFVAAGLLEDVTPERQAQFDVVTDLLDLAQTLLGESAVHPGAAAMLIGATLEEYLRVWVERLGLDLGTRNPGIQAYAELLSRAETLKKQDVKFITGWAGLRNHAAHGEWEEVSERKQVEIMLEGVRLFMQKHGA